MNLIAKQIAAIAEKAHEEISADPGRAAAISRDAKTRIGQVLVTDLSAITGSEYTALRNLGGRTLAFLNVRRTARSDDALANNLLYALRAEAEQI